MICKSKFSYIFASLIVSISASNLQAQEATTDVTAIALADTYIDVMAADYLGGLQRIIVAGQHGIVGLVKLTDDMAILKLVENTPDVDFTSLHAISDKEALLGSSTGMLYKFDGEGLTEIAQLSEYAEPILDIASDDKSIWAVGGRGLIYRSTDRVNFEEVVIEEVTLPLTEFPGSFTADWYLGAANLDAETLKFTATIDGKPAVEEEDYILYSVEGFIQFQRDLDMDPAPTVATKFAPGPPYRKGDVTWNVVLLNNGRVTLAGEFGMILQSDDGGDTWIKRDTEIVPREPEPAYWMAGYQRGNDAWLTGAAGVSQKTLDNGETWEDNPRPGREGIFGVVLAKNGIPVISGAVGLIGTLENGEWNLADRTELKLLSWIKTPVELPDGRLLVLGGRGTAILVDNEAADPITRVRFVK